MPFRSCFSKIINTFTDNTIDNARDLDINMPTYNLLEYSDNYSVRSGSLLNYFISEINDVDDNALNGC